MSNKGVKKIRLMAAAGLVTAALVSAPASAHHGGHNYVAPLAAFIALNALFHHHHYRYHHHRHYGHRHHRHHRPHHRKHSHSHGGYHGPRHKHHRRW